MRRVFDHFLEEIEDSKKECQIKGEDFVNFCGLLKGHLISKWFFEVVDFLQKTNENTSHTSKNEFIRSFFGGNR